jgi:hypothetical protein
MAARVIPFEDSATGQNISITATDATPEGCILTASQNSVTFTNNAGASISIAFNPTGIFTDINNLPVGQTSPAQTAPANGSVNYYVTVAGVIEPNGPYAIQSGIGPMYVVVSGSVGNETCTPDPVAIPVGGTLQMNPALSTNKYSVDWTNNNDPFMGGLTKVDSTPHTENPLDAPDEYPYTVSNTTIQGGAGNGKGTVIVVSS